MLVIISDTHLTDGTSGNTIRAGAFRIFAQELSDLAYDASKRADGRYEPIKELHLLLLGDILDVIRSTQWLDDPVRPWDDPQSAAFTEKIAAITRKILSNNSESLAIFKSLKDGKTITIPPATPEGKPAEVGWNPDAEGRVPVEVHTYYMVGNHDWFYHLHGPAYDDLRREIVQAMGLDNPPDMPFPHDPREFSQSEAFRRLAEAYRQHSVFARHGDIYDADNFDGNRDQSSIGDAIVVDLIDKFSPAVQAELGAAVPAEFLRGLREVDNIRPLSDVAAWIDGLVRRTCPDPHVAKQVKRVWNQLASEFFKIPFVKKHPKIGRMKWAQNLTRGWSLNLLSRLAQKFAGLFGSSDHPDYKNALEEAAFLDRSARCIVYGHTHQYVLTPLDVSNTRQGAFNQVYLNSGTWRPYHQLAKHHPQEEQFVPYQLMTYLAFYQDDERGGQRFESWSGALGE
jgi:UDP-2,3-diacylglucosamine pyrophosphatase LpxH